MSLLERHEEIFDKCIQSLNSWKDLITEYFEDDMKEVEMRKLQNIVNEYCIMDTDFQRSENAFKSTEEHINNNTEDYNEDIQKLYKNYINSEPENSNLVHQNSSVWKKIFKNDLDVVEVKKKKKIDSSEYDDLGDSILCSSIFTPPVDPISKAIIKNPSKNKKCKHIYENSTIVNYIKQQKGKAKCPYIGCSNNQLRMTDIVEDRQLQTQIENYLETQHSTDSEESD